MNRITEHFHKPKCKCQTIRRRLRKLAAEANAVEKLIGSVAEFIVPTVASYLSGDRREARLFLSADFAPAQHAADVLPRLHELGGANNAG